MTTKQSSKQAIYDHLQKVREAVEAELTNGDIQGVMEAESENIFNLANELLSSEASELAMAVKERSDDPILIDLAEALWARINSK